MQVKIDRDSFLNSLSYCQGVLSSRSTLPILAYYLLEAKDSHTFLSSTNLEVGVKTEIPSEIIQEGSVTLPGRKIFELINGFPKGMISLFSEENFITLKKDKIWVKIGYLSPEEFPNIPIVKGREIEIKGSILKNMIKKTSFCVSHEETQYVLNGIYIMVSENLVNMVATDGVRLSFIADKIPSLSQMEIESILPLKTYLEINRIMNDEDIKIVWGEKQVQFSQQGLFLTSRVIEGEFPDYKSVIPRTFKTEAKINKEEFERAVRRAYIMTKEKSFSMKLNFNEGFLKISTKIPDEGESLDEIEIELQGDPIEILFDPAFIIDVLKVIDEDTVFIGMNTPKSPCVIRPYGNEDYLYVVMPMKI